jgi:hypothetical protein
MGSGLYNCITAGSAADIAIVDLKPVSSSDRGKRRFDLPGGGKCVVTPSHSARYTVVNGVRTYAEVALVASEAAEMLRS